MLNSVANPAILTLSALRERYRHYNLTIRSVCEDTVKMRLAYVDRLFNYLGPPETAAGLFLKIDHVTLGAFFVDYAMRYGPGSRQNMYSAARAFLRFAYEEQFMANDLSALVPTVRRYRMSGPPKALPEACILALEESIDRSDPVGRRDAAIICLLSTYGVRGIQVRRLRLEDMDWQNERIHFPAAKGGQRSVLHVVHGKFGKQRFVPMSPSTCSALTRYMGIRSHHAGTSKASPLFIGAFNKALSYDQAHKGFLRLCQQCGLCGQPPPRLHDLRHNYACRRLALWREEGRDINTMLPVLATAMGHVNIMNTQIYLHIEPSELHTAATRLPNPNKT